MKKRFLKCVVLQRRKNVYTGKTEKSMGVNALLNGLNTLILVAFSLITYPYAARVLQVENMGKITFSNSIVNYFILFAGLGITTYAIREGAGIRKEKEKFEKFVCEMFSINLLSSAASLFLLAVTVCCIPRFHSYTVLILVQSMAIIGNVIGVVWLYSIVEDYAYITARSLIVNFVALVLMFVFVQNEADYIIYVAIMVIANAGANVFNFIHARKYVKIRFTGKLNLSQHMKPILIIFVSAVTTTIYVNSDNTILGFLADEYHVGLYSIAVNVYTVLKKCISAVVLVSLPRLSHYLATDRNDKFEKTATEIFKTIIIIMLPVIMGVFVTADAIIRIVGGPAFGEAVMSLRILSVSLFFSILAIYYTNTVLLPMKMEIVVLRATVMSALVNIVLNFLLLGRFKQNGAAFTTLIAEVLMCVYQLFYVNKHLKIKLDKNDLKSVLIGCGGILIISWVCDQLYANFVINLCMKILLSALLYAGVLIGLKNESALFIMDRVLEKIKEYRNFFHER